MATVVFNVKVFEFETRNGKLVKLAGRERAAQKRRQMQVYRDLTAGSTSWSCAWRASSAGATAGAAGASALPGQTFRDAHAHSLAVQCPVPAEALDAPRREDGRLGHVLALSAVSGGKGEVFSVSGVPVCALPVVDAAVTARAALDATRSSGGISGKPRLPLELAACTQVTDIDPKFDTAALTRLWVDWNAWNGVQHQLVYVDANKRGDAGETAPLERAIETALADRVASGDVRIVYFHLRGRGWLETQQMMETHCLWRYKRVAEWVLHDDIDEFMQPLGSYTTLREALRALAAQHGTAAAFQVPQSFWGHMSRDGVGDASIEVWNMTWRSSGPFKRGREKMLINTKRTEYISVHQVTTAVAGSQMHRPDPTKELRVNHFRRHFKGLGAEADRPSWADSGIGPSPLRDTSFRDMWHRLRKANARVQG